MEKKIVPGNIIARMFASIFFIILITGPAYPVPAGKTIEYKGGNMGKVIFDGKRHGDEGYHCLKCHNSIFITKTGSAGMTYVNHSARKEYCFACHNGADAFDAVGGCNRCHLKGY